MTHHNRFIIDNHSADSLALYIEPEGAFFPLAPGEEVSVSDEFTTSPVTIRLTASAKGEPILSIWPGDGEVRVEKDGVDVFDLLQRASESHTAYQQHGPPAFADPAAAADRPRD
ncbi:MAG TPA: hypothetical protein DDY78_21535 [Planctomycetales bacterium]|jgi:hypothetical protein|nr:hypothetical protein [Planctomycetales bacterium]